MTDPLWTLGEDDVLLAARSAILDAAANAPRSLQTAIGPSEVGQACTRRLAHRLAGTTPVNDGGDNWRPTVGTAVHAWLADALTRANDLLGANARWLIEQRVDITAGLSGSCDAYDMQTGTVLDWKVVGPTSLKKQKANCRPDGPGPGDLYRTQVHLYGLGHRNAGHDVKHVAVAFLPSAGSLGDTVYWTEPYNQALAEAALERLNTVRTGLLAGLPASAFPATPDSDRACLWCPFYAFGTNNLDTGCPGVDAASTWIAETTTPPAA